MVFLPGGEDPRHEIEPSTRSVGIRVTKRNCAISEIQRFCASIYRLETNEIIGNRNLLQHGKIVLTRDIINHMLNSFSRIAELTVI